MKSRELQLRIGIIILGFVFCFTDSIFAQESWPFIIKSGNRILHVYKPETESYNVDKLSFRSAMSVSEGNDSPVFGSMWGEASLKLNSKERTVEFRDVSINELRFPDGFSASRENDLNNLIRSEMSARHPKLKMDEILADLDNARDTRTSTENLNNAPPEIIYANKASILVVIDGDPIVQASEIAGVEMIVNTPFLILKYQDMFYLGNGSLWYRSSSPLAGWTAYKNPPSKVLEVAKSIQADSESFAEQTGYPQVIISTKPAELIQTDGAPQYSPIKGTSLNYVSNTEDEILFDINEQLYYLLLSGRWYRAAKLTGAWEYVSNENLPADFAKIPEGSDKDVVLASVPGTKASFDAVRESQVPQAAVVDRQTASTSVVYDGEPQFESIAGTEMRYASNSSNTVIVERNRYYVVDNGVWFVGASPSGPWAVSDCRPVQINVIPPSCPVYNVRYVNIYYATPSVVYVGYTRGYLSSYVHGRVVVYGTGYHYRPWRGRYYYPRPCTWGFGMNYNPWNGWSVNFCYGAGWFVHPAYYHRHHYSHYHYRSGWWGPPVYRPPYRVPYTHCYGTRQASIRSSYYSSVRVIPDRVHSSGRQSNVYASSYERRGVAPARASTSAVRASTQNSGRTSYVANYGRSAQPTTVRSSTQGSSRTSSMNYGSRGSSGVSSRPSSRPSNSSSASRESSSTNRQNTESSRQQSSSAATNSRNPSSSPSYAPTTNLRPSNSSSASRESSSTSRQNSGSSRQTSSSTATSSRSSSSSSSRSSSGTTSSSSRESNSSSRRR
ncbi:MAG: hypothetical protein LBC98_09175 [Prevotellaceae bacterium]|jgi:hypothetical protein|nr:hypothetical protein [Prevotellaceae bacterium]